MPMRKTECKDLRTPPIFRWAGSKRKLIPHLLHHAPPKFTRYVEPFAGSACLFFALRPHEAVLGDINYELLNAYAVIRRHPQQIARAVYSLPDDASTYYWLRSTQPDTLQPVERTVRFVYLNRYCFNGVYRTNKSGGFNVPRGTRTGSIPSEACFLDSASALERAELRVSDFTVTLADARDGDFVYLDPPYALPNTRYRGEYGCNSFALADTERLIQQLLVLDRCGARFLLSYAQSPLLERLIPDAWTIHRLEVRRHVAGFATHRVLAPEVLITNYG
jgi:DNA adenine methylase